MPAALWNISDMLTTILVYRHVKSAKSLDKIANAIVSEPDPADAFRGTGDPVDRPYAHPPIALFTGWRAAHGPASIA